MPRDWEKDGPPPPPHPPRAGSVNAQPCPWAQTPPGHPEVPKSASCQACKRKPLICGAESQILERSFLLRGRGESASWKLVVGVDPEELGPVLRKAVSLSETCGQRWPCPVDAVPPPLPLTLRSSPLPCDQLFTLDALAPSLVGLRLRLCSRAVSASPSLSPAHFLLVSNVLTFEACVGV